MIGNRYEKLSPAMFENARISDPLAELRDEMRRRLAEAYADLVNQGCANIRIELAGPPDYIMRVIGDRPATTKEIRP